MNTSVNLSVSISNEIGRVSQISGLSKSYLVRILIEKIKNFKSVKVVIGTLIEYQRRTLDYERVHYFTDPNLADYTKGLRFKFRLSLSAFVTAAFLFFWDDILGEIFGECEEIEELVNNYEQLLKMFSQLTIYFSKRLNFDKIDVVKRE